MASITVASASGSALTTRAVVRHGVVRRISASRTTGITNATSRRSRSAPVTRAAEGEGGESAKPDPAKSAEDARAALLAKAAAYKKAAEKDSKELGGKAELASVIGETVKKLDEAKDKPAAPAGPPGKREVKVKIMTREKNYNPFDEDEQVVGIEEGQDVYTPEAGAEWGDRNERSAFADMLKQGRRRERGIGVDNDEEEVITLTTFDDSRYASKNTAPSVVKPPAAREGDEEEVDETKAYKPKVNTWGVFPRPDNISKTYGGGKTIKAGEYVAETEEEKEERRARVRAKLKKYRVDAGIEVDNATQSRWTVSLTECKNLMRAGKLAEARDLLEPICMVEQINPRTELGGEITFHYAMCLDNTQRRDEALEMYKRCVGNPHGQVSKQADRMIWGMTSASKMMKADQFDYDGVKDKYDPFLIKMTTERQDWKIQTDPEEEEALQKMTVGSVALVFAIPLAMGALIAFAR